MERSEEALTQELAREHEAEEPIRLGPLTMDRRAFLNLISVGLGGLLALPIAVPFLGFLLQPILMKAPTRWESIGKLDEFQIGSTVQRDVTDPSSLPWGGMANRTAVFVRRESQKELIAFSVNCTHLGCPLRWEAGAELFLCPCHGGVFYRNGQVAGGPPPRPMVRYPVRVRNGGVEVMALPSVLGVE